MKQGIPLRTEKSRYKGIDLAKILEKKSCSIPYGFWTCLPLGVFNEELKRAEIKSSFCIEKPTLPIRNKDDIEMLKAMALQEPRVMKDKGCILIVDDEVDILQGMSEIVETWGYTSVIAGNGEEALRKLNDREIDLIISDINMPIMNGIELGEEIVALNLKVPIIYMSGAAEENKKKYFEELKKIRPEHIFDKIVSLNELNFCVKKLLRRKKTL